MKDSDNCFDDSLNKYLEANAERISILSDAAKGKERVDFEAVVNRESEADNLRDDIKEMLIEATAIATMKFAKDENLNANEKQIMVKSEVRKIQRLLDSLSTTAKMLSARRFQIWNVNRGINK